MFEQYPNPRKAMESQSMSRKFVLPVPNATMEGFEMKTVLENQLTDRDREYLEKKAELQKELGNEQELDKLLQEYVEAKREEEYAKAQEEEQAKEDDGESESKASTSKKKSAAKKKAKAAAVEEDSSPAAVIEDEPTLEPYEETTTSSTQEAAEESTNQ
jgi:hypothetical protein